LRKEVKGEIADLRAEVKAEITGLRAELKSDIAESRADFRSFETRVENRFEEQRRQWELAIEIRERLAALEAQARRR
jgi:hypothetical protein